VNFVHNYSGRRAVVHKISLKMHLSKSATLGGNSVVISYSETALSGFDFDKHKADTFQNEKLVH
jgi:hypothetical protein